MKKTATEFKRLRLEAGMTQAECAARLGYAGGKTVIYRKETGRRPVTSRDILALQYVIHLQGGGATAFPNLAAR